MRKIVGLLIVLLFFIITGCENVEGESKKESPEEKNSVFENSIENPKEEIKNEGIKNTEAGLNWLSTGYLALEDGFTKNVDLEFKKLDKSLLSLEGIYIVEELNSPEDIKNYNILSALFVEYLIGEEGESELKSNIKTMDFKKHHENWLKNRLGITEDITLSSRFYRNSLTSFTISEGKLTINFDHDAYETTEEFLHIISIVKPRIKEVKDFLGEKNTIDYGDYLEIKFTSTNTSSAYAYSGRIEVNTKSLEFSLTHELIHVYTKLNSKFLTDGLPNNEINNDYYQLIFEEGLCDYGLYFLNDDNIDRINDLYLNSLFTTKESSFGAITEDYRRNSIFNYFDYKDDNPVTALGYVNAAAVLSLTDIEFLKNGKNFYYHYPVGKVFLNSYEEATSFVYFIIENYGRDKFFSLKFEEQTPEELFGKSLYQLKEDWLLYLGVENFDLVNYKDLF